MRRILPLLLVAASALADGTSLDSLFARLASEDPAERDQAQAALETLGSVAAQEASRRMGATSDPEVRGRLADIVETARWNELRASDPAALVREAAGRDALVAAMRDLEEMPDAKLFLVTRGLGVPGRVYVLASTRATSGFVPEKSEDLEALAPLLRPVRNGREAGLLVAKLVGLVQAPENVVAFEGFMAPVERPDGTIVVHALGVALEFHFDADGRLVSVEPKDGC